MISGAYAYREDQHVRVDVLYTKFSPRGKAIADIISSVFFFIFTITLLWTGWRFASDAIQVGEHSFTEWGIQYWPVKLMIPVGARSEERRVGKECVSRCSTWWSPCH